MAAYIQTLTPPWALPNFCHSLIGTVATPCDANLTAERR